MPNKHAHYPAGDIRAGDFRVAESERHTGQRGPQRVRTPEELEFASVWGGMIIFKMQDRNQAAAQALFDKAWEAVTRKDCPSILDTPLAAAGFCVRDVSTCERKLNARTVGDFLNLDLDELERTPYVGAITVRSMLATLLKFTLGRALEAEAQTGLARDSAGG